MSVYQDYARLSAKYRELYGPQVLVAYEVGKFYEWYNCDQNKGCDVRGVCELLNMQCTRKSKAYPDISATNPLMGGVPVCAFAKYVPTLLEHGYTIVVVSQTTNTANPTNKTTIERKVTEIMSRGTYLGTSASSDIPPVSSVSMCIFLDWHLEGMARDREVLHAGCAVVDVTTGTCACHEINATGADLNVAHDELYRIVQETTPSEVLLVGFRGAVDFETDEFVRRLGVDLSCVRDRLVEKKDCKGSHSLVSSVKHQEHVLRGVFPDTGFLSAIEATGLEFKPHACSAFVALLTFISEHNENSIVGIQRPELYTFATDDVDDVDDTDNDDRRQRRRLLLSYNAAQQLNIITTTEGGNGPNTTLLSLLDTTCTRPGSRFMREQLLNPLVDAGAITRRLDAIQGRMVDPEDLSHVRETLKGVVDIERLFRKIALRRAVPRDLSILDASLQIIAECIRGDSDQDAECISRIREHYLECLDLDVATESTGFERNVFRRDVFPEMAGLQDESDTMRARFDCVVVKCNECVTVSSGAPAAFRLDGDDESSNICDLRVGATPKRCQALLTAVKKNGESVWRCSARETDGFKPSELTVRSHSANRAHVWHPRFVEWNQSLQENDVKLQKAVQVAFEGLVDSLFKHHEDDMVRVVRVLEDLDFACACAWNALKQRYTRPSICTDDAATAAGTRGSWLKAEGLRHPIVEALNKRVPHVTNDVCIGGRPPVGILLYGMNAAGKSCLMKASALAVVMAQAGMYVAADAFTWSPFTQIFTRIQSHDDLARGQSTFMVEMSELRNIIKRADRRSLVIGDEICSGTEGVSALAIVGAAVQHLISRSAPFFFATHLHGLPDLLRDSEGKDGNDDKSEVPPPSLRVCHLRVRYDSNEKRLVYDRNLCEGQGATVYGLEVCKALDMDAGFVDAAHALRRTIMNMPAQGLGAGARVSRYNSRVLMDMCGVCKLKSAKETHHIRHQKEADEDGYIGTFHKNAAFNLVPLCEECHEATHRGKIHIRGYLQTSSGPVLDVVRK